MWRLWFILLFLVFEDTIFRPDKLDFYHKLEQIINFFWKIKKYKGIRVL